MFPAWAKFGYRYAYMHGDRRNPWDGSVDHIP